MGCVQSLFNQSKSRSPSPENEFVPPTFDTVVVTRQPQKSKSAKDEAAVGRSTGDEDGDDDVVSKCEDFERHALEHGGVNGVDDDDSHSVHFVEATAVRTLAANTGSVAILGTTAKCKSVDGSPAVHHPLSERQRTWSPTALSEQVACSKSQPQLEVRYVEATAVRTLAADTGSIAILGTTADPKPQPNKPSSATKDTDAAGMVHYVQATAVRHLAAETGSIAILASTAAVPATGQQASGHNDFDLIPVGVREVLDLEPGQQQQPGKHEDRPEGEPQTEQQEEPGQRPLIPLPVIYAMEMKPGITMETEGIFKTVKSSSVEKPHYSQVESTTLDDGDMGAMSSWMSDASSRRPLIRQTNKTSDQSDIDYILSSDVWMPKVPVFAKCPPAKSKSLPSRDTAVADVPTTVDGKGDKQHGVIRGSSLPYEGDNSKTEHLTNDPKRKNEEDLMETTFDNHVIAPNTVKSDVVKANVTESNTTNKQSEIEVDTIKQNVLGPNAIKSNEYNMPNAVGPNEAKPTVVESNEAKPNDVATVEKLGAIKPNGVDAQVVESNAAAANDVSVNASMENPKFENEHDGQEKVDGKVVAVDGKSSENETAAGGRPAVVDEKSVVGEAGDGKTSADAREADESGKTCDAPQEDPENDADAEYRLTMIQSVREAVNRICEQAVEKTAAIVKNGRGRPPRAAASSVRTKRDATDDSDAADYASSEFSLPPPPPQPSDTTSTGQESSWPPPPPLSEAEEERTIAPGFSFDLPDPPTEMDQLDSETDKLDISDEEMRAIGLPSDEDDKTDTGEGETDDGVADDDDDDNGDIVAMKSTSDAANGTVMATATAGSDDGAMGEAADGGVGDRAATTIQAVYRGFRARKYVETVNAAAIKIQAGFRGYRVRQSLKNAAPSTATTTTDDSQCWSDDDQKSVVSVTYAPLKEFGADQPVLQQQQRGLDDDDDDDDPQLLQTGDDEVFEHDDGGGGDGDGQMEIGTASSGGSSPEVEAVVVPATSVVQVPDGDGGDDDDDVEALTNAAVKIQARVRGFAARKRLNDEKNGAGAVGDGGGDAGGGSVEKK